MSSWMPTPLSIPKLVSFHQALANVALIEIQVLPVSELHIQSAAASATSTSYFLVMPSLCNFFSLFFLQLPFAVVSIAKLVTNVFG